MMCIFKRSILVLLGVAALTADAHAISASDRFAVIRPNGTLARGVGVASSARPSTGVFRVIFNRNVTGCAYSATLGNPGSGGVPLGIIGVAGLTGNPNGVTVVTRTTGENLESIPFHLLVMCRN